jgi:hypothetical protein
MGQGPEQSMADIRDRSKRAHNLASGFVVVAVYSQSGWLNWIVSHWGRLGEHHGYLLTYLVATALGLPSSWYAGKYVKRLPDDAVAARIDSSAVLTKESAASVASGIGTALIIWGLVGAGVTDDLRNGTSLGSPYIFVNAALAGVAAALAVSAFVLRNLRRLPVTPDRPVVPRWPPGWPPPPPVS